jgi:hypothetical protein
MKPVCSLIEPDTGWSYRTGPRQGLTLNVASPALTSTLAAHCWHLPHASLPLLRVHCTRGQGYVGSITPWAIILSDVMLGTKK